ncbi:MAG: hypothetical protein K9N23_18650 [Akkermansiaceae bacterium]|nr:hypothetical protein [Akkermansiaceae bacterium]MCF7733715.1 hypothetical protein [Akkermansiaceae bacterium]
MNTTNNTNNCNRTKTVLTLAAVAMVPFVVTKSEAAIEWGSATTISADTDVSTTGTLEYAYATGNTTDATVNGVVFEASTATVNIGGGIYGTDDIDTDFSLVNSNIFGSVSAPFSSLSADYQNLLDSQIHTGTNPRTVTLNNLTVGLDYLVQIWANDSRSLKHPQ